jgi:hypothetical protein
MAWVVGMLVSMLLVGTGVAHSEEPGAAAPPADPQAFKDYINNRLPTRAHHTWGIFLGTGWNKDNLDRIEKWQREGKWTNPFTGEPFDNVKVFVFGKTNPLLEGFRIVSDHLEIHVLSSWEELQGQHFDFAICHSNGCTNAIGAHRDGVMQFQPGELRGADLTFFVTQSDPIWKIPAPNWAAITEQTPGLRFTIPFGSAGGTGQPRYPVIRLAPPSDRRGTLTKPLQAHALVDTYFQGVRQWMRTTGPRQQSITEKLRTLSPREERQTLAPAPSGHGMPRSGGCPPPCGGGSGPGSPGPGTPGMGQGVHRSTPTPDPRGGIAIDIRLTPDDFRSP